MRLLHYVLFVGTIIPVAMLAAQGSARNDYDEWLRKNRSEFSQFVTEQDREFAGFLEENWVRMETMRHEPPPEPPKPIDPPLVDDPAPLPDPDPDASVGPLIDEDGLASRLDEVLRDEKPPFVDPPRQGLEPDDLVSLTFLGHELALPAPGPLRGIEPVASTEESLGKIWLALSEMENETVLREVQRVGADLQLGDWSTLRLLEDLSVAIYPQDRTRAQIALWYLLLRSGYDVRLAYNEQGVFLLFAAEEELFELVYLTLSDKKYYLWGFGPVANIGPVYTYAGDFPAKLLPLRLALHKMPRTVRSPYTRSLSFRYSGGADSLTVDLDRRLIEHLDSFPQKHISSYFPPQLSVGAMSSLATGLKPLVADKDELTAVQNLLLFVQTAFDYQTDQQQFGHERYLLAEETLFYPASDCEDRSVFFSLLVRTLVGLEVVGLDYPGHIATGVCFSSDVPGDGISHGDKRFVVCDPTYINARVGQSMPRYRDVVPGVIEIEDGER
jgi:hypothetical protein